MKRTIGFGILAVGVAGALILAVAPAVRAVAGVCSNASIQGKFGFTQTGTRVDGNNPGPRAFVGRLTADGHGNLAGVGTKSSNGVITQGVTFTGTYSVNADCTGSMTVTQSDGDIRHDDLVVLKKKEIQLIQTDPGRIQTGIATPLAPVCSNASIGGRFGFTATGTRVVNDPDGGPQAALGVLTADGLGNLAGSLTESWNGVITQGVTFTGTYSVNADCTGSMTLITSNTGDNHLDLVVLRKGEIRLIATDAKNVVTVIAKPLAH